LAPAGQSIANKTTPGETKARALALPAARTADAFNGLRGIRNASPKATDCSKPLLVAMAKFVALINGYLKARCFFLGLSPHARELSELDTRSHHCGQVGRFL
jgi:hypothetical protein